jgi:uncharacterized protein (DUF433 family)
MNTSGSTTTGRRALRSVRLPAYVDDGLRVLARRTGRDVSAVVNELLEEGLRMRRIPGIVFGDSRGGRVARIAGSGLAVWEIARAYRDVDSDWRRLSESYHWLTEGQLRAGLAYAEAYPDEIAERIGVDEEWTPERVWQTHPFTRPEQRA